MIIVLILVLIAIFSLIIVAELVTRIVIYTAYCTQL